MIKYSKRFIDSKRRSSLKKQTLFGEVSKQQRMSKKKNYEKLVDSQFHESIFFSEVINNKEF